MNIRIISERTSRKVAFIASIVFMILAWLFVAALFVFIMVDGRARARRTWGTADLIILGLLFSVLAAIPVQIRRYFRTRRSNGACNGEIGNVRE